jgi:hypothetical protein
LPDGVAVVRLQGAQDSGVILQQRFDAETSATSVLQRVQALMNDASRETPSTSPQDEGRIE